MGRKRNTENKGLPKGLIFNKKAKTYYLRVTGQKDIRLGVTLDEAYRNYYSVASINYECTTMHDLIDRYLKEVSPTKAESTHESNIKASKHLFKRFGHMTPTAVRARHAYQFLDLRAREGAPVRGNREFALLSSIMSSAVKWGVIDDTPFHNIMRNEEKPRERLVTDEEVEAFIKYCPLWLQLYVELKVATGMRQSDMLSLTSKDWEKTEGLRIQTSKTSKRQQFNATSHLAGIVNELKSINGYKSGKTKTPLLTWFFFPSKRGGALTPDGFRTAWSKAMRAALKSGELVERFQERDLRAMAATKCESLTQAFELLGHSSIATTKRVYRRGYAKVDPIGPAQEPSKLNTK